MRQVNGRVPILMGCGGNNTAAVVNELRTADIPGIDGILSVCPYYNPRLRQCGGHQRGQRKP